MLRAWIIARNASRRKIIVSHRPSTHGNQQAWVKGHLAWRVKKCMLRFIRISYIQTCGTVSPSTKTYPIWQRYSICNFLWRPFIVTPLLCLGVIKCLIQFDNCLMYLASVGSWWKGFSPLENFLRAPMPRRRSVRRGCAYILMITRDARG